MPRRPTEPNRPHRTMRASVIAALLIAAGTPIACADDHPVFLQWFETRWSTIEYRVPDFFMAGYDSTWLPPPSRAADPSSPGYDPFDRFDLGSPGNETAYGTREQMRAMIEEFHQAGTLVYFDAVLNHNSARTSNAGFYAAGGYPGFAKPVAADTWGDFHDGTTQSTNPQSPNYNLWEGDLVGLIDIAHEKNYQYIRQPTVANIQNIPPGTVYNKPNVSNAQFYPDTNLTPLSFNNPSLPIGQQTVTLYPFNAADPMQGDPILENATAYLARWMRWMTEVIHADGYRLDAAKHIPQWFFDQYYDSALYQRRKDFAGNAVTPFSFGEVVDNNSFQQTYIRKDTIGNRDCLDLNGAGQLRDLINPTTLGLGSWDNVLYAHLDTADGGGDTLNSFGNNGSIGVNHVFSHDNGSTGTGSAAPPLPGASRYAMPEWCYLLFRPGLSNVYYNSREFIDRYTSRGFWPREGNPTALGTEGAALNSDLIKLVRISNGYARGEWRIINYTDGVNSSREDVLVFERKKSGGPANVLVGVNDSYSSGVAYRSVQTSFPVGTRLHELTSNHADPVVDVNNEIPELLVVDSNQRVLIPVPNNQNSNGVQHHKGYVVYGPATPSGTLQILKTDGTAFPGLFNPDASTVASYKRRITPIPIVDADHFEIRLTTTKTDASDPDWDDNALFRIDAGYPSGGVAPDFNGQNNGPDISNSDSLIPRFENFVTQNAPLATTVGATNGLYRQTIDTSSLSEGLHYIKVVAFRRRLPFGSADALFTEFRAVIYVSRNGPSVTLADAALPVTTPFITFRVLANDRAANNVHILVNPPAGDPLTMIGAPTQAAGYDRYEWRKAASGFVPGPNNTVKIVAFEATGKSSITTYTLNVTVGSGDVNSDGRVNIDDLYLATNAAANGPYYTGADLDVNGVITTNDVALLESKIRSTELQKMAVPQR